MNIRALSSDFDKTEDDMKALQSVGQIIGEILKQLDDVRCQSGHLCSWTRRSNMEADGYVTVIVKASSGPRYVVSYRPTLPVAKVGHSPNPPSPSRKHYHHQTSIDENS